MHKKVAMSIELDGDKVHTIDSDDINEFYPKGEFSRKRATNVEFDNDRKWWYVQDLATSQIVADGFVTRREALEWEHDNYMPGAKFWQQAKERQ